MGEQPNEEAQAQTGTEGQGRPGQEVEHRAEVQGGSEAPEENRPDEEVVPGVITPGRRFKTPPARRPDEEVVPGIIRPPRTAPQYVIGRGSGSFPPALPGETATEAIERIRREANAAFEVKEFTYSGVQFGEKCWLQEHSDGFSKIVTHQPQLALWYDNPTFAQQAVDQFGGVVCEMTMTIRTPV